MTRLIIAEDHKSILQLLEKNLPADFECFAAHNGKELIEKYKEIVPHIILSDIEMPVLDGLTACSEIRKVNPYVKIIIYTAHSERYLIKEAIRAGVNAYILKEDDEYIIRTLTEVLTTNRIILSQGASRSLVSARDDKGDTEITKREAEIIKEILRGRSTKEIADKLCNSPNTIKRHRYNIFKKLNVNNVAGLLRAVEGVYLR